MQVYFTAVGSNIRKTARGQTYSSFSPQLFPPLTFHSPCLSPPVSSCPSPLIYLADLENAISSVSDLRGAQLPLGPAAKRIF